MKIIKEGYRYQGTCPNCGCVFECTEGELALQPRPKGNTYCPECPTVVKVERVTPRTDQEIDNGIERALKYLGTGIKKGA